MNLFQLGDFVGASGLVLPWKVQCLALTDADWEWAATYVAGRMSFGEVEGVKGGGLSFATALNKHRTTGCGLLIVDDVLTTGGSMNKHRGDREAKGFVLFSRARRSNRRAFWINSIWRLGEW